VRWIAGIVLLGCQSLAQESAPIGIVRGALLEREITEGGGEFLVRATTNRVFRFAFDGKTYIERDKQRIHPDGLREGETVEIVSDHIPGVMLRYARTVHVVEPIPPPRRSRSAGRVRAYRSSIERLLSRGDRDLSGLISRLNESRLVLRTRDKGSKLIFLRPDTAFLENGFQVEGSALRPNTRVFVRAGKNLDDELEAYQVIWGDILRPRP
jgi:hypothetical protein